MYTEVEVNAVTKWYSVNEAPVFPFDEVEWGKEDVLFGVELNDDFAKIKFEEVLQVEDEGEKQNDTEPQKVCINTQCPSPHHRITASPHCKLIVLFLYDFEQNEVAKPSKQDKAKKVKFTKNDLFEVH